MIPARRIHESELRSNVQETVPVRLARLRLEQRGPRHLFSPRKFVQPLPSPSLSRVASPLVPILFEEDVQGKVAGPPAPASWTTISAIGDADAGRRRLLQPLDSGPTLLRDEEGPPSLLTSCARIIVEDLDIECSTYLATLSLIPSHLKLKLMEEGPAFAPLNEIALLEIFRDEVLEDDDGAYRPLEPLPNAKGLNDCGGMEDWDYYQPVSLNLKAQLTTLNLTFSTVSLRGLRLLLLSPARNDSRRISNFPNLERLNLTATPNLPVSARLLATIVPLHSLRCLSLAGKSISGRGCDIAPSAFIHRLAISTPTLYTIDLSWLDTPLDITFLVGSLDWETKWRHLNELGIRRWLINSKGEDISLEKRSKIALDVRKVISERMHGSKHWVEIIT